MATFYWYMQLVVVLYLLSIILMHSLILATFCGSDKQEFQAFQLYGICKQENKGLPLILLLHFKQAEVYLKSSLAYKEKK